MANFTLALSLSLSLCLSFFMSLSLSLKLVVYLMLSDPHNSTLSYSFLFEPVRPNLAKFRNFGETLKVFGIC